jgi:hypothetical protein
MNITRTCLLTGATNTRFVWGVTPDMLAAHRQGAMAQDAFKGISAEWREFIMTGILPETWEETFPEEDVG